MRKVTQVDRVVRAARSFQGVCAVDFLGPDVVDGGKPITRVAARIQDAEDQGYVFEIIGWRAKTKVYRLVSEPADAGRAIDEHSPPPPGGGTHGRAPVDGSPSAGEEQDSLFDAPTRPHWQDEAA